MIEDKDINKKKVSDMSDYSIYNESSLYNMLKCELINLKLQQERLKLKSEFYELIFYTSKNCIDQFNYQTSTTQSIQDLGIKMQTIFTQNNKHYYEQFSNSFIKDNNSFVSNEKDFKSLQQIEKSIIKSLAEIHKFIISDTNDKTFFK